MSLRSILIGITGKVYRTIRLDNPVGPNSRQITENRVDFCVSGKLDNDGKCHIYVRQCVWLWFIDLKTTRPILTKISEIVFRDIRKI